MKKKILSLFLMLTLLCSIVSVSVNASETLTMEVPIEVSFQDATGIDLNIRLNPLLVESAKIVNPSDSITDSVYIGNQDGNKFKVAIASATPLSNEGTLFYLQLTLKVPATETDELCKLLQVKINEKITWKADNCILLGGVEDGGLYKFTATPTFNEGTATLNGAEFESGTEITKMGDYTLLITDLNGKTRQVNFVVYGLGDMNFDGSLSINDATTIQKHLAHLITLTDDQLAIADVSCDEYVSIRDATTIQMKIAKIIE